MNSIKYQEIVQENIMPSLKKLMLDHHLTCQQTNKPKHISTSTQAWSQNKSCDILEWLPQSPDLNLTEDCSYI